MFSLKNILNKIKKGTITPEEAVLLLANKEENIGHARVDITRLKRKGFPEVIYCPGKTAEQISDIMTSLRKAHQDVTATRATLEQFEFIKNIHPDAVFHKTARMITIDVIFPRPKPCGMVGVLCAGTADIPVAEEAALTAERLGAKVERIYDVGIAGIHRLLGQLHKLQKCKVIVAVAGMEGVLPSVIGGLVPCPIIAVPTSVGYGASFGGIAPLLTMLNSCAPGISVVNIDNGFGAGVNAALINKIGETKR